MQQPVVPTQLQCSSSVYNISVYMRDYSYKSTTAVLLSFDSAGTRNSIVHMPDSTVRTEDSDCIIMCSMHTFMPSRVVTA